MNRIVFEIPNNYSESWAIDITGQDIVPIIGDTVIHKGIRYKVLDRQFCYTSQIILLTLKKK